MTDDKSVDTEKLYYTRDYGGRITQCRIVATSGDKVVLECTEHLTFEIKEKKELFNSRVEAAQDYFEYWFAQLQRDTHNMNLAKEKLDKEKKGAQT